LAASSGLTPGDQISSINGRDVSSLNHKDAENLIKNAGNQVDIGLYKANMSTWKPNVSVLPTAGPNGEVTKTSLAANKKGFPTIQTKVIFRDFCTKVISLHESIFETIPFCTKYFFICNNSVSYKIILGCHGNIFSLTTHSLHAPLTYRYVLDLERVTTYLCDPIAARE
jgi:hypothetical protein